MIYTRNVLCVHIFQKKKISVSEKQVRESTRGLIPGGGDYPDVSKPCLISYNNRCFFVGILHLSSAVNTDRIG